MRRSIRLLLIGMIASLAVPAFLHVSNIKEVHGYSSSSAPKNLDLNDTEPEQIKAYYKDLNDLISSERQGTNLLKNLKPILKNGQKYFSYDSGDATWQAYEIIDRDWSKSPATSISGYNAQTKTISNYTYGTSLSSPGSNPYVHALYVNRFISNPKRAWTSHGANEAGIDREHIWPKSQGMNSKGNGGARGDLHHLWAADPSTNSKHGNDYYGYVDKTKTYTKSTESYQGDNYHGYSKTFPNINASVFEPQDSDKGDIARAVFYMAARYNNFSGSDTDGFDQNNPNFLLVQNLTNPTSSDSTATTPGRLGIISDLLEWNRIDPPDQFEIHRNNLVYTNFTKNRNPFIDYPEWAEYIWGKSTDGSYSPTSTGYASPNSDVINGWSDEPQEDVPVTGVSLNKSETSLEVGSTETLVANISPNNATIQTVTWSSNNEDVATVEGGVVTAVAEGEATITVTTQDGGFTDECTVTVTPHSGGDVTYSQLTSIASIDETARYVLGIEETGFHYDGTSSWGKTALPTAQTPFYYTLTKANDGQSFTAKTTISDTVYYLQIPTSNGFSMSTSAGTNTDIKIGTTAVSGTNYAVTHKTTTARHIRLNGTSGLRSYANETGEMAYFYKVNEPAVPTLTGIELNTENVQLEFEQNTTFSYSGLVVTANYSNGDSKQVTPTNVTTPDLTTVGTKTVTVTYTEEDISKTADYEIEVIEPIITLTSISVSEAQTTFEVGDEFVKPIVTATYSNGDTEDVTEEATFSGYDLTTAGNYEVAVSYTYLGVEKTTSYEITVTNSSGTVVASQNVEDYAKANNWENGKKYLTMSIDSVVTATANGGTYTGNYYTTGHEWRFYQSENATITISATDGYVIDSITLTYNVSNNGILIHGDDTLESGTSYLVSEQAITFTISKTGTGSNGQVKFTDLSVTYHQSSTPPVVESISAVANKNFAVGEVITKSDITVTANTGAEITDYTFTDNNYQFRYTDAASGGALTEKTFTNTITYGDLHCDLTVNVSRTAYVTPSTTTINYTGGDFEEAGLGNQPSSEPTTINDVNGMPFTVTNCYVYNHTYFSPNSSKSKRDGVLTNASPYSKGIKNIEVDTASSIPDFQVSVDGRDNTWVDLAQAKDDINYYYFKMFYKNPDVSGFVNITSITVTLKGAGTPLNLANYIMFTDTNGQCEDKFSYAESYFENLSSEDKVTFMTSTDYVLSTASERFRNWAAHQGKQIVLENSNWVIKDVKAVPLFGSSEFGNETALIAIIAILSGGAILSYFFLKKRKYNQN